MKIYIDHPKLKKRAFFSHAASLGGFFVLMAGIVMPLFLPRLAVSVSRYDLCWYPGVDVRDLFCQPLGTQTAPRG